MSTAEESAMEELIDEQEAAILLHQTARTLAVWRCEKKGPSYVKLGRRVFYRRSDVRRYIESRIVRL